MNLLDLFVYEIVRSHHQELLESARSSRVVTAAEPTRIGGMLRKFGRRFTLRMTPTQTARAVDGAPHGSCHDEACGQRLRAGKDAA